MLVHIVRMAGVWVRTRPALRLVPETSGTILALKVSTVSSEVPVQERSLELHFSSYLRQSAY